MTGTKERITKMIELKKEFKEELVVALGSMLELIQNKTEIEDSLKVRAEKACEALKGIAELERNTQAQIILKNGMLLINSRNIETKSKKLEDLLYFVNNY